MGNRLLFCDCLCYANAIPALGSTSKISNVSLKKIDMSFWYRVKRKGQQNSTESKKLTANIELPLLPERRPRDILSMMDMVSILYPLFRN